LAEYAALLPTPEFEPGLNKIHVGN